MLTPDAWARLLCPAALTESPVLAPAHRHLRVLPERWPPAQCEESLGSAPTACCHTPAWTSSGTEPSAGSSYSPDSCAFRATVRCSGSPRRVRGLTGTLAFPISLSLLCKTTVGLEASLPWASKGMDSVCAAQPEF